MNTKFLICRQPEADDWNADLGNVTAGNYTLERLLKEIQTDIETRNEAPWTHYVVEAHGDRYEEGEPDQKEEDWVIAATCDRWHLTRYEVYQSPAGQYTAVLVLYYAPAVVQLAVPPAQTAIAA